MAYKYICGNKCFYEKGKLSSAGNRESLGILAAVYDPEDGSLTYSKEYDKATFYMSRGGKTAAYSSI